MAPDNFRPPTGLLVSLPLALGMIALFFVPWFEVSCGGADEFVPRGMEQYVDVPDEDEVLCTATGLEFAQGDMTGQYDGMVQLQDGLEENDLPRERSWAYLALGMPALIALLSMLGLIGALPPSAVGKGIALFGLVGLACMVGVWSVDYIADDIIVSLKDQAGKSGASVCPKAIFEARERLGELIVSRFTPWFYVAMGLHGVTSVVGLAVAAKPGRVALASTSRETTTPAYATHDYLPRAGSAGPPPRAAQPSFSSSPEGPAEFRTPSSRENASAPATPSPAPLPPSVPAASAAPPPPADDEDGISFGEDI